MKGQRRSKSAILIYETVGYYRGGKSIRDVAKLTDRSYGAVHRMLLDNGVELRPRGGWHR